MRLCLETPDDLLPSGTDVIHPGVTITMWDQLDTAWPLDPRAQMQQADMPQ